MLLRLDPKEAGLAPSAELPRVFGVMMETGYPEGSATLGALADGTTSLYTSSGGGIIGGGDHEQVAAATAQFVRAVESALDLIPPASEQQLPASGRVVIRALTYRGPHAVDLSEDDLGYGRHPLSPVFHAGHEVIAQLRLIDEAPR
jgi:hypothetical protein